MSTTTKVNNEMINIPKPNINCSDSKIVTIDYKSRGFNNVETLDDIFMDEALSIVKTIFQKN